MSLSVTECQTISDYDQTDLHKKKGVYMNHVHDVVLYCS